MVALDYGNDIAPRPHTLVVKAYNTELRVHECSFGCGRTVLVDLFVNGDFPEEVQPADLIGKIVKVGYTHGWVWLAHRARLVSVRTLSPEPTEGA